MTTLLELVETLARDPQAKAAYEDAPDAYLARSGFGDLSPAEVNEAVLHSADALPPLVSAQFDPNAGLASVAGADPVGFDQSFTSDYEEDLFGLDQDSPIFADGELNDAPLDAPETLTNGRDPFGPDTDPADHSPPAPTTDVEPEDQLTDGGPDADGSGDEDEDEDSETLRHLFDTADPHDLDTDPGTAAALPAPPPPFAGDEATEPAGLGPQIEEFDEGSGDGSADDELSSSQSHLTDSDLTDTDLFEQAGQLAEQADQPLLHGPDQEPFDVGADQPDDDILEDVGDFELE